MFQAIDSVPLVGFLVISQLAGEPRTAGMVAVVLAAVAIALRRLKTNPIVLGINVYFLLFTPLVTLAFLAQRDDIGQFLITNAIPAVMACVFVVGLVLTFATERGFVGEPKLDPPRTRQFSLILLGIAAFGFVWSIAIGGDGFAAIGLPMFVLFGTQRFLITGAQRPD